MYFEHTSVFCFVVCFLCFLISHFKRDLFWRKLFRVSTWIWTHCALGPIFYEFGIFVHLFGYWWQIGHNWRSMLEMQKLYIHSYFTFMDFGALKKHILTNIADFGILTLLGPICFTNLGYFVTYLATGDKLGTIGDPCCICKRFISIHTSLWWILWHWGNIFWQILTIS